MMSLWIAMALWRSLFLSLQHLLLPIMSSDTTRTLTDNPSSSVLTMWLLLLASKKINSSQLPINNKGKFTRYLLRSQMHLPFRTISILTQWIGAAQTFQQQDLVPASTSGLPPQAKSPSSTIWAPMTQSPQFPGLSEGICQLQELTKESCRFGTPSSASSSSKCLVTRAELEPLPGIASF